MRVKWDQYELTILIALYSCCNGDPALLKEKSSLLSAVLRQYAIDRGIAIDDNYRNVAGMNMLLQNAAYLFTNGARGLPNGSASLKETYEIFRTHPGTFKKTLTMAQRLMPDAIKLLEIEAPAVAVPTIPEGQYLVDWDHLEDYVHTVPVSMTVGQNLYTTNLKSWKDAYVRLLAIIYDYHIPGKLESLKGQRLVANSARIQIGSAEDAKAMLSPKIVADDLYAETNSSAHALVKQMKLISSLCNYDIHDIRLLYTKTGAQPRNSSTKGIPYEQDGDADSRNMVLHDSSSPLEHYLEDSKSYGPHADTGTVVDAAVAVLEATGKAMTLQEIYQEIVARDLYHFLAINPLSVVTNAVRNACKGVVRKDKAKVDIFGSRKNDDDRDEYYLLKDEGKMVSKPDPKIVADLKSLL